ncbi:hypothetical protein [Roseibium sp.]|uniref:hypothetical protein n=1 Tax=Roseibium sp. TaxID=1936156 RepID=UPI003A97C8CD
MTGSTFRPPKISLGVGSLITESFSLLFRNFVLIVAIAFAQNLLGNLISGLLVGYEVAIEVKAPNITTTGEAVAYVLSFLSKTIADCLGTILLVQLVYEIKLRQPVRLVRLFDRVPSVILPMFGLNLAFSLLAIEVLLENITRLSLGSVGYLLLCIPQFWLYSVFFVMAPAIVIEHLGVNGLGRSAGLTKGYRWPIMGLVTLINVVFLAVAIGMIYVIDVVINLGGSAAGMILYSMVLALDSGFVCVLFVLTYVRLREIKEGVNVNQIASVFD